MIDIIYVTGNKQKIDVSKKILGPLNINVIQSTFDCPEIQAETNREVVIESSKYASNYLKANVFKNDSGLVIPALNGFPSAYTKYVEETIGEDGIIALMIDKTDRSCYFIDEFAYCEYGKEPVVFSVKTYGTIALKSRGTDGIGYDKIFIPEGYNKTLAEIPWEERHLVWNDKAYRDLAEYLKKKINTN